MLEDLAASAQPFLDSPVIRRVRRNHALEHATVHILSTKVRNLRIAGRSSASGFVLIGNVPTETVEEAVQEALRRMKGGERELAIHPNCGTNLFTSGALTGLVGLLGFGGIGRRRALDRLPLVMTLMMLTAVLSQPLGMSLQRHFTTEGDLGDMEVTKITRTKMRMPWQRKAMTIHRVSTRSS